MHTFSEAVTATAIRIVTAAPPLLMVGYFRFELYTDCLGNYDFEETLGFGLNGSAPTALPGPLALSTSRDGFAMGVNDTFAGEFRVAFLVRNTKATLTLPNLAIPENVGSLRLSLSLSSSGSPTASDTIAAEQKRGNSIRQEQLLHSGSLQQQDAFKTLDHVLNVLPDAASTPLTLKISLDVQDRDDDVNEYRLYYVFVTSEILDCSQLGTYLDSGICRLCDGVTQFQNQTNQTSCLPATQCNATTEYEEVSATRSSDRHCLPLTQCSAIQFEILAATSTSDRQCQNLTNCQPGSFVSGNHTYNTDRNCSNCQLNASFSTHLNQDSCQALTAECQLATEYESLEPTTSNDRQCTPLTICDLSSQYVSLNETSTSDRQCRNLSTCVDGQYIELEATLYFDRKCHACTTTCATDGSEYLYPQCTANTTVNNDCLSCPSDCNGCVYDSQAFNQVRCSKCKDSKDRQADGTCKEGCAVGEFSSSGTCQPCSSSCLDCNVISSICTACFNPFSDPTLTDPALFTYRRGGNCVRNCSAADVNSYGNNTTGVCSALTQCDGTQFESQAPTFQSNRVCQALTNCANGQYPSKQPTATSDRECLDCAGGTFDTAPGNQGSIANCSPCPPGTTDDDSSAATACVACVPGRFLNTSVSRFDPCDSFPCLAGTTDHDSDVTTPCITCPAGHYTPQFSSGSCSLHQCLDGTTDHDSDASTPCEQCAPGQVAPTSKIGGCAACLQCNQGEFETTTCTPSTSRQCQQCKTCTAADPVASPCSAVQDTQCESDVPRGTSGGNSHSIPILIGAAIAAVLLLVL